MTRRAPIAVRIEGGSMWPLLRHGTSVRVGPVERRTRVGDVVAYTSAVGLVVHRVVAVSADALRTRGDACAREDAPVPRSAVVGVVTHVRVLGVDGPWLPAPGGARVGRVLRGLTTARRAFVRWRRQ